MSSLGKENRFLRSYLEMYENHAQKKAIRYIQGRFHPRTLIGFRNYVRERILLDLCHRTPLRIFLDVGCASGRQSILLATKGRGIGIDVATRFVLTAQKLANHIGKKKHLDVSFLTSLSDVLPFREASFDLVLCGEILEHIIGLKQSILEIKRVLRAEGRFVLSVPNLNGNGTLWGRISSLLLNREFTPLEKFSFDGILEHGDAHIRRFDVCGLTSLLERNGFTVKNVYGCCFLDLPLFSYFFNALGYKFWSGFYSAEIKLSRSEKLASLGRHIILEAEKTN